MLLAHLHPAMFNTAVLEVQGVRNINSTLNLYTLVYWLTKANKQKPIIKSRSSIIAKSESE